MTLPAWATTARYVALTTVKRDGTPVSTPVWFVVAGDSLRVTTGAGSGKVKRIAHTPDVTLAPCDSRGRPKGPALRFRAEVRPDLLDATQAAVAARYGWQAKAISVLFTLSSRVRRKPAGESTALQLTPS